MLRALLPTCHSLLSALTVLLAVSSPPSAAAAALQAAGAVTAFDDGDSFDIRLRSRGTATVRLHAIDAPELVQPHGEAARRALIDAVAGRPVRVECYKRDARGRFVCRAWVGDEDLQLRMLRLGHAWHLTTYLDEQTKAERSRYTQAQAQARAARRGLWARSQPMPPWSCRNELRRLRPCR